MNELPLEYLELSKQLLGEATNTPDQAALRRAISTAYYALFHLLTLEASGIFVGQTQTIELLVRAYDHGTMANVSKSFFEGKLPWILTSLGKSFSDSNRKKTLDDLKLVAGAFVELQEARHKADYDLSARYDRMEAAQLVDLAESAFSTWKGIREDDLARIYLSSFLVHEAWNKRR